MNIRHNTSALATLALTMSRTQATAGEFDASRPIGEDWRGARTSLAGNGIRFKLGHYSQAAHNTSGGHGHEAAYADRFLPAGAAPIGVQRHECPIELNHDFAATRGIAVMPSVRYVRHPGGLDADNATIPGLIKSVSIPSPAADTLDHPLPGLGCPPASCRPLSPPRPPRIHGRA